MRYFCGFLMATAFLHSYSPAFAAPPTSADVRLLIQLVASEPDIVTPTGVAVDQRGRVWVIENHTHQRPAKYKGPLSDRIRILDEFGSDGKAGKITTWAEGFQDTMGITFGKGGDVFVATRSAIYLLRDVQGKGRADEKLVLARLDTKETYPHDGLSGFAVDARGDLYFGLGENFGKAYKLIGRDNRTLTGGGEGGSIYRMQPDGSGLTRIATGFWNPFHLAFDRWGRLFAVDNDPDSRGPCRLLHIIQDGDYGYRYKYGRKGIHPFQSWNGELPGTLPMVAGTAEAPSGILAYESSGWPEEYRGSLLVTSWGDHVIEQFQLEPRGASFGAKKKVLVRGDNNFRPVGIALAPDGSVIVSDWVDQSYPVHGKGRIWRIRPTKADSVTPLSRAAIEKADVPKLLGLLRDPRRDVRLIAADTLADRETQPSQLLMDVVKGDPDPLARLHALWALMARSPANGENALALALKDKSPPVRAEALALRGRLITPYLHKDSEPLPLSLAREDPESSVRLQAIIVSRNVSAADAQRALVPVLKDPDPFLFSAAVSALARLNSANVLNDLGDAKDPRQRLGALLAQRAAGGFTDGGHLGRYLADPDPAIRRAAIQWVGEERLDKFADLLDKSAAKLPISREVFEAWLAAKDLLANPGTMKDPTKEIGADVLVLKVIGDAKQPAVLRGLALRMLRPDHAKLKLPDLIALTKNADPTLRTEALKTLTWRGSAAAQQALREVAGDTLLGAPLRSDAILGLALSAATDAETRQLLIKLIQQPAFATDALRSLRGALAKDDAASLSPWWKEVEANAAFTAADREDLTEHALLALSQPLGGQPDAGGIKLQTPRPETVDAWRALLLKAKGDAAAGERVFFHSRGPRCYVCHRIDGRGEAVGPDLSRIGAALTRAKLIESILEPNKEIAPAFVTWLVTLRNGKQHSGVIIAESFDSKITLADTQGKHTVLHINDIEDRVAQTTSIMPSDLHGQMTRREFADLLAFLEERK